MSQTHYFPARLNFGKVCWSYYSIRPADKAIVFVHGLHGDATDTWMQFQSLLQGDKKCQRRDIFYFGYHSLRRSSESSASSLFEFLETLATDPARLDAWPAQRRGLKYSRILVVAHSLGAIVSRRAFLMGWELQRDWTSKLELALYAPAHLGGRPLRLIPKQIKQGVEFLFPTLEELLDGSDTIKRLQEDTQEALKQTGSRFLRAVKVIHGRRDNVITKPGVKFCGDPPCDWIDADHIQICKPSESFPPPFERLRKVL